MTTGTPYAEKSDRGKEHNRKHQRARQRAYRDLAALHPKQFRRLFEERLAEEGVRTLREREVS